MSRKPAEITPEQREARIAELRAQRKARLRTLAWRSGIVTAALVVLSLVAVYWLLQTVAGRNVLLAQVVARLPTGSSFTWKSIEGPLAGPLTLNGVEFHFDQIHFTAERVYLDPDIRPLLGKRLRLDALQLRNATLDLPKSDEPFKLPTWPDDVLPQIELPLAIQADDLRIDGLRLSQQGEQLIDIASARGGIDIGDGYAKLEKLRIESDLGRFTAHGEYRPSRRYRTDLVATAVFPAPRGRTPARLGLVAKGNASDMLLAIAGNAPAPLRITASVKGRRNPDWQFRGRTEALDPGLFGVAGDNAPLAFDLQGDGHQGTARLQGRIEQGTLVAEIEPSQVRIDDHKVLTVEPLALRLLDGRVVLRGTADFADETDPKFNFAINARQLRWGGDAANNAAGSIVGDADLGVAGRLKAWAAIGKASLQRDGQEAAVDFDARGDDARATLHKLAVVTPGGKLGVTGDIGWSPKLDWKVNGTLDGFDPGYFLPDWKGDLSGKFASAGAAREATANPPVSTPAPTPGFDATLDVPQLRGHLRARALDASGKFALHGNDGEGEIALRLGDSKVDAKGRIGAALAIDAQLQPLHLADLLPGAGGSLAGTLKISGTRDAPNIDANLDGNGLKWQDYAAQRLSLHGRLPWRGDGGELAVNGSGIVAGLALDSVRVDARGAVENLRLDARAGNPMIALALSGSAIKRGANWQGALDSLQLTPGKGDAWRLQQATRYSQAGTTFTLSPACLAASGGNGMLCVEADWPRNGINAHADALPLTLVQPWLPKSSGRDIGLNGNVSLDASFKPRGNAWEGEFHLASLDGGVRIGGARREVIGYDHFSFDATFDPQDIKGRLGTGFKGDGYVDATFATGWDDFSLLKGDLYFHNSRLFWLELFSPDLVQPKGVLAGHISLTGTRGKPLLNGEARLTEFTGELPSLGIALTDGEVALTALADGSAKISGRFGSQSSTGGEATRDGYLQVDGDLSWLDGDAPLDFNVRGDNFLIADTTELRIVAAPDLQVEIGGGTIRVGGKVVVPSARIDIEKLDTGVSASEDVVVLDPADPERAPSSRLDLGLAVTLGDAVKLKGYGLDGSLSGTLNVRSRPGQSMAGTGQLEVEGRYAAYGQKLQITQGRLSWSNSPIGDPNISLRAEREVISADVTAGISVTGRATAPRARVWSDPELPESEALAYLVLGRSLNTASSSESQQINAANSALSAGAGLLASQLGAKIGLDDAGVLESRTLGGSVFGIGKYLSPKLYVSYGVSMVGEGSAVTLKYLMRKGFDVEIESSTIETRGSLNWRKEK
ncbi:MAG: translocation/assembly module TamB domain-containing protein [Pseudoxanthomonas sp.]